MTALRDDLRLALRSLRRRPVFAGLAIATLALGIGGMTAIVTVVDGILIRDLPYRDSSSLVGVWRAWPRWKGQDVLDAQWDHIYFPTADYLRIRESARSLAAVEAYQVRHLVLTGGGPAEELAVGRASAGLFHLLGVRAVIGRTFTPDEALPLAGKGAQVVLLSHELWTRRYGGDPAVLGRPVLISQTPYEVIGVLPNGFRLASDEIKTDENAGAPDAGLRDAWIPLGRDEAECGNCLELVARLARSAEVDQAQADVQRLLVDRPGDPPGQIARVVSLKERLTAEVGSPLAALSGAAGVLLLIACLNVAGLLVGETLKRRQEMAVRAALGAGRSRLVRQVLTESAVLGLLGALAGAVVAWLGTQALLAVAPATPRLDEVSVSGRAFAFAVVTGIGSGLLFGLAPALTLVGTPRPSRSRGGTEAHGPLRPAVVSAQVGLTVVLLVAGGLFGRSLSRLMAVDPGFVAEGLVTLAFRVPPAHAGSDEAAARFQERVVQAARSLPGVTASSATTELPFPGGRFARSFTLGPDGPRAPSVMRHRSVLPDYHETMGIPLLQGRHLAETDGPGAPRVAVVSRSFAERTWPGEPALEKRIYNTGPAGEWTIVGVVGDVRQQTLAAPPEPTLYRTTAQVPSRTLHLVARTGADPRAALRDLRRTISGLDPDTPITEAGGVPELIQAAEGDDRFRSRLVLTFAVVATLLAGVGIFTITAFTAAARTREIGIRAALGASDRALAWLVFREGLISAVIGVALGFVAAVWLAGVIRHLLYEIDSRDPITYLVAGALTFAACGVAGWWPALRVGRMAPAEAIRHEEWA